MGLQVNMGITTRLQTIPLVLFNNSNTPMSMNTVALEPNTANGTRLAGLFTNSNATWISSVSPMTVISAAAVRTPWGIGNNTDSGVSKSYVYSTTVTNTTQPDASLG
jgi:hypothetical protein